MIPVLCLTGLLWIGVVFAQGAVVNIAQRPLSHDYVSFLDPVQLNPNASAPSDASPTVPKNFIGFAFEAIPFRDFASPQSTPNIFSRNLIQNIADRTNSTPSVRVGGTSMDHSFYNHSQKVWSKIPKNQLHKSIPHNVTFGPAYFEGFANLQNVRYGIDYVLAYPHLNMTVRTAEDSFRIVGQDKIQLIEIGNEPNLYSGEQNRNSSYGPANWGKQWIKFSDAIAKALDIPTTQRRFQALALSVNDPTWEVQKVFPAGLFAAESRLESVAYHYYQ